MTLFRPACRFQGMPRSLSAENPRKHTGRTGRKRPEPFAALEKSLPVQGTVCQGRNAAVARKAGAPAGKPACRRKERRHPAINSRRSKRPTAMPARLRFPFKPIRERENPVQAGQAGQSRPAFPVAKVGHLPTGQKKTAVFNGHPVPAKRHRPPRRASRIRIKRRIPETEPSGWRGKKRREEAAPGNREAMQNPASHSGH